MPTFLAIVRWIALIPAALIAGYLGYFLLSMQGIDLNDFKVRACHLAASGLALGGAYVYVGAYVAPAYKPHTAVTLAVIAGVLMGAMIAFAFVVGDPDYWALWQGVCIIVGASTAAIVIATEGLRNPLV